jgi:hypothetical protein
MQAPLQRGEIETPVTADHHLAVQHHADLELVDCRDDLREVPAEGPLLAGLQRDTITVAEGDAAMS